MKIKVGVACLCTVMDLKVIIFFNFCVYVKFCTAMMNTFF